MPSRRSKKASAYGGSSTGGKPCFSKSRWPSSSRSPRTIDNYLSANESELRRNGYEVLRGTALQDLKLALKAMDVDETDFVNITRAPQLGVFSFRAFLNLTMLITESERARLLRQTILDIVIDTINRRTGGGTKYINQRDEDFIHSYFQEENYRREFTDTLETTLI